jgi:DNA-binding transcriptional ArsR family regulator
METENAHVIELRQPGGMDAASIFDILSNDIRRYVLHYLAKRSDPISLGELAELTADMEEDYSATRYEHLYTALHHSHLPRLVDAGVIEYDPEAELIVSKAEVSQLAPYLELAEPDDI